MITVEDLKAASQGQLDELLALLTKEYSDRGLDITTGEPFPSHAPGADEPEVVVGPAGENENPVIA